MKKEKSCGAVVYKYQDGNLFILLLKHIGGHWSFPKGHMEKGEMECDTAVREVFEETNLDVVLDLGCRLVTTYSPKEDTVKDVVYFVATPKGGDMRPQEEEISEIEWLLVDDAFSRITYQNDKQLLEKVVKYLTS